MNNNPIGVFDSGIGGATVLKEILKILPNENYIFYSDSKNNPYGDKNDDDIFLICDKIVRLLIDKNCKAIVIACNTASCKVAEKLREKYQQIQRIEIEKKLEKMDEQKEALKKALDEDKSADELKKLSEELQQTMFSISQKAYEAVQKDEQATASSENASSSDKNFFFGFHLPFFLA